MKLKEDKQACQFKPSLEDDFWTEFPAFDLSLHGTLYRRLPNPKTVDCSLWLRMDSITSDHLEQVSSRAAKAWPEETRWAAGLEVCTLAAVIVICGCCEIPRPFSCRNSISGSHARESTLFGSRLIDVVDEDEVDAAARR